MSSQTVFADDYLPPPSPPTSLTHAFSSNITLAAIVILACVVFLIALLHFYAQCLLRGRRPRSALIALRRSSAPPTSSHTGLDAATIAKLPTFTYTASVETGSSRAPLLECAVCLCEFQENEKGRTLPACKHAFHIECIDMWFLSHSTCPLCRTVVLPTAAAQADAQQQQAGEQGAGLQASLNSEETPALGSTAVQLPCNVLFWGNTEQITSLRETSSSPPAIDNSPTAVSGVLPQARRVPQVAITIPAIDASVSSAPVRDVWSKSARFQGDQATTSSQQALRSPGLRASLKKILSRQSSWHTAPSHEGSV